MPTGGRETAESTVLWMPKKIVEICVTEAIEKFPLETGGTFMGYWADYVTAVVTTMIGPGPNAYHTGRAFQPDEYWQRSEIARLYSESMRRNVYIGDWHTHPNALTGLLSRVDRHVLRRIIKTPSARCVKPIMMIFWGKPDDWQSTAYCGRLRRRPILWDRLVLKSTSIKYFSENR